MCTSMSSNSALGNFAQPFVEICQKNFKRSGTKYVSQYSVASVWSFEKSLKFAVLISKLSREIYICLINRLFKTFMNSIYYKISNFIIYLAKVTSVPFALNGCTSTVSFFISLPASLLFFFLFFFFSKYELESFSSRRSLS